MLTLLVCVSTLPGQAGGGGGAAGAGSGAAGSGAGAAAGAAGARGSGGQSAAPAQGGTPGQASAASGAQSQAQSYAAGATLGIDPRTPPPAAADALTLHQVLDLTEARNPTILAVRQNLNAVRAQEIQAATRANPYFGVNGTNVTLPLDGSNGNPPQYAFQFSRLFERGDKRHFRVELARSTTAQTQAQLQENIRAITFGVKQAFFQMLIAKQALALSTSSLKDFRHEVDIANERYKAGDLGKLDFERLDLQLGSFESDESNDLVTLRQASTQLQSLMGVSDPKQTFDITNAIVPPALTQTEDFLLQQALASRPDYAAARFAVTAALANSRLAIANGTSDPTLEAEFDKSGFYNSVGFNVNFPLRIFDKNQGNKETARFQIDAGRYAELAARNQVISDVTQAWIGYSEAKRLSDRFTEHYLDESRDVLSIAQFAFEHGGIALIDYLDALRDARSSTSNALNAYLQTWLAVAQLSSSSTFDLTP